jgi:histidinol-phosphate aminotransferase
MSFPQDLMRDNIRNLKPYQSARETHQAGGYVYLDANENPFGKSLNRYPDPLQHDLKERIGREKSVDPSRIFLGNGSDEIIDLVIRAFVEPATDNVIIPQPTYGMYEVASRVHGAEVRKPSLAEGFQPDVKTILEAADRRSKIVFLCSPNNPSGNLLDEEKVVGLLKNFGGLVVLDEAYLEFAASAGFLPILERFPNLIILRTFSKAAGLAGIRLGYAFAVPEIINVLTSIKYPYNVNRLTQEMALRRIGKQRQVRKVVRLIRKERQSLTAFLNQCRFVEEVYPSDANFLLVRVKDPASLIGFLSKHGVIIRDRSNLALCERSVRITVGKPRENKLLKKLCRSFDEKVYGALKESRDHA